MDCSRCGRSHGCERLASCASVDTISRGVTGSSLYPCPVTLLPPWSTVSVCAISRTSVEPSTMTIGNQREKSQAAITNINRCAEPTTCVVNRTGEIELCTNNWFAPQFISLPLFRFMRQTIILYISHRDLVGSLFFAAGGLFLESEKQQHQQLLQSCSYCHLKLSS